MRLKFRFAEARIRYSDAIHNAFPAIVAEVERLEHALERLDYLHRAAIGLDELTDEADIEKSDVELYEDWKRGAGK